MTENLPAVKAAPVKVDLSQPISDLDQAMRLADALSKSTLVPDSLAGKPASVLHVILTGQALDLHWTEALRVIYSPGHGQIGMRAQFLLSQLRKAGHRYSAEYSDDGESCTFTLVRKDEPDNPYTATFSRQDAIDAKLTTKDNWTRYFKRMLRARAITDCVGFGAPEVLLGFVVEGDEDGQQAVQLQPTPDPAPPAPAGEAAPGGQAAQAEQLRELSDRMATVADLVEASPESPAMGGNPANAIDPDMAEDLEAETVPDPAPVPTAADVEAPTAPSASASSEAARPADLVEQFRDPEITGTDASARAKKVVLSEWLTKMGYDPKIYRAEVLRACSVYTRRTITGTRDLRAAEVMGLINELSALYRRTDELAPVTRLADAMDAWEQAWQHTDPDGYAAYEEGK